MAKPRCAMAGCMVMSGRRRVPALLSRPVVGMGRTSGLGLLKKAGHAAPGEEPIDVKEVLLLDCCGVPRLEEEQTGEASTPPAVR